MKKFFRPLKQPLRKDPLLLCMMIMVGFLMIGITLVLNSVPIIILLSLLVFFASILAYCSIENYIINRQSKKKKNREADIIK